MSLIRALNQNPGLPSENDAQPEDDARIKEACQEFESVLVGQLISTMRTSSLKSDVFGESGQSDLFGSLMDQEIASAISHEQGMGLADLLYQQLTGKSSEER